MMDYSHLREDFPTLRQEDAPAYLDNACVTLKPDSVIKSISDYYSMYPGCCLLYTSPSPRDVEESRMPSSA